MMQTKTAIVALAVVAIIVWYWAEWQQCVKQQRPMNPIRNPLALLGVALQRLWRNRTFLGILIACWLASAGIYAFAFYPLVVAPRLEQFRAARHLPAPESGQWVDSAGPIDVKGVYIYAGGPIGNDLKSWVLRALPQCRSVQLRLMGSGMALLDILALGIMAVVLMRLWFRRPKWLPLDTHQRLIWPIYLTLGGFLVMAAYSGFGFAAALSGQFGGELSTGSVVLYALLGFFLPSFLAFATAPLTAFLWHIVVQVGGGRYWNLHHAVVGAVRSWLPIAWLTFTLALPYTAAAAFPIWRHLPIMPGSIFQLAPVIRIVLLFVPWIILAERVNFLPSVVRNFQLIRSRWCDLLILLPRYLLIMVPVYALLSAASWATIHNPGLRLLVSLTRSTIELVLLVTIVVLYTKLREAERTAVATEAVAPAD